MTKAKTAKAAKTRAISNRTPPVAVEYDAGGKRATKNFDDAVEAKSFYVAKHKAGKNPTVKGELAEQVTAAEPAPADETSKPVDAPTTEAKPAKDAKPVKEVERDAFGCRVGSQAAKINACVTKKPKTAAAIAEETGLAPARVRAHVKFLVEKGHATESEEGVCLKASAAK